MIVKIYKLKKSNNKINDIDDKFKNVTQSKTRPRAQTGAECFLGTGNQVHTRRTYHNVWIHWINEGIEQNVKHLEIIYVVSIFQREAV